MASWFSDPVFLAVWIGSAIAAMMIGTMRLREPAITWVIVGLVLGPFAVLWALLKRP